MRTILISKFWYVSGMNPFQSGRYSFQSGIKTCYLEWIPSRVENHILARLEEEILSLPKLGSRTYFLPVLWALLQSFFIFYPLKLVKVYISSVIFYKYNSSFQGSGATWSARRRISSYAWSLHWSWSTTPLSRTPKSQKCSAVRSSLFV